MHDAAMQSDQPKNSGFLQVIDLYSGNRRLVDSAASIVWWRIENTELHSFRNEQTSLYPT